MKRILALLLALVMALPVIGCAAADDVKTTSPTENQTINTTETNSVETEPTNSELKDKTDATKPMNTEPNSEKTNSKDELTKPENTEPTLTEPPSTTEPVTFETVNQTVYATNDVNIRTGPGVENERIDTLKFGDSIKRIGIGSNGWDKVEYNGQEAYIKSNYLTLSKPMPAPEQPKYPAETQPNNGLHDPDKKVPDDNEDTLPLHPKPTEPPVTEPHVDDDFGMIFEDVNETVYATKAVNVRKGPGTEYEIITTLSAGESVTRTGIGDQNWDRVEYNGETAYIHHNYLSTEKPNIPVPETDGWPKTYSDGTCTITVYKEWFADDNGKGAWCYAAHLEFTDYTRFGMACANGKYNSGGETTSAAGKRLGAILCVNGDYATPGNGAGGYAIARGGVVCNDGKNYCEGMYNSNNGMFTYRTYDGCSGKQLSTLVAEGKVTDTMQFGPAFLLNGDIQCGTGGGRAQRTFIGTNGNAGDIWIVVSDGRNNDGESAGLTGWQCAEYLRLKGCTFGIPLDGGGSSTIWFNGEVLNAAKNGQRSVADFVYFK